MMRGFLWAPLLGAILSSTPVRADTCQPGLIADLPVTMAGLQPLVPVKINGQPVEMLLDTGAFTTIVWRPAMAKLGLKEQAPMRGFDQPWQLEGVGGFAHTKIAVVDSLELDASRASHVTLLVEDAHASAGRSAGLLGRAVLGLGDLDFDFTGGHVRMVRSKGCGRDWVPPWMAALPGLSSLPLLTADQQGSSDADEHGRITATIVINGVPVRALFDTGASTSVLSMQTAARLGLHPGDPDVVAAGATHGIGPAAAHTWIAKVDSLKIGDEEIRHTRVRFGEIGELGNEMLIGADFFRSHRVYAALSAHKLYFAYRGGPVFDLSAQPEAPPPAR